MTIGALACGDLRPDGAQRTAKPESSAMRASSARGLHQRELLESPWKARLEHFGRVKPTVPVDTNDGIVAIGASTGSPASRHQVVARIVFLVLWMITTKNEIAASATLCRHDAVGHTLRHRP